MMYFWPYKKRKKIRNKIIHNKIEMTPIRDKNAQNQLR